MFLGSTSTIANDVVANGGDKFLIYSSESGKVATASSPTIEEIDSLAKEMNAFPLIQDNSLASIVPLKNFILIFFQLLISFRLYFKTSRSSSN